MINHYLDEIKSTILPLSVSTDINTAMHEWYATGDVSILDACDATCELCGKEGIKYLYTIRNKINDTTIYPVGSSCILSYGVAVYDDNGKLLTIDEAEKELSTRLNTARKARALAKLTLLAQTESNDVLAGALRYYTKHGKLTPKLASVVLWRLETHDIDHDPSMFGVKLSGRYADDYRGLPSAYRAKVRQCLTSAQRKRFG